MHRPILIFCGLLFSLGVQTSADDTNRQEKNLNVFNIVKFPNDPCTTSSSKSGVCYTASECTALGGENQGSCAQGFGVCCYQALGCGDKTSSNNTYFVSTGLEASPCTLTVCKASEDICQIRMDFDNFDIDQPVSSAGTDTNPSGIGQCQTAMFYAGSDAGSSPIICGNNAGYHMIVDAKDSCNELTFIWGSDSNIRAWNIKVSQFSCNSPWKAPQGCLQYFTGTTGKIYSYNYRKSLHLANQNYENCIRQEEGYCSIKYYSGDFSISGTATTAAVGEACLTDFVSITRGASVTTIGTGTNADRFCGGALSYTTGAATTMTTSQVPFQVGVVFDSTEVQNDKTTGFEIYYAQQTAC